jgi:hypothetical protein
MGHLLCKLVTLITIFTLQWFSVSVNYTMYNASGLMHYKTILVYVTDKTLPPCYHHTKMLNVFVKIVLWYFIKYFHDFYELQSKNNLMEIYSVVFIFISNITEYTIYFSNSPFW